MYMTIYMHVYTYIYINLVETNISLGHAQLSPTPCDHAASIFLQTRASPSLAASLPHDLWGQVTWDELFVNG